MIKKDGGVIRHLHIVLSNLYITSPNAIGQMPLEDLANVVQPQRIELCI
jgi:hypothetical protein